MKFITLSLFLKIISSLNIANDTGSNWAVLIAGSNSYYNYRHQSDISHSYQILTQLGSFPPSHIITMMYDDVAWSESNPFPGQLFNEPDGADVYKGIRIDYKQEDVTADNLISVLRGEPIPNRPELPVLNHTQPTDNIFVYYSDHGAPGLVSMPTGSPLYADDLQAAFHFMHEHNRYNEMVFYLEACESGSMFDGLLDDTLSIFATTASDPSESSFAYYYNDALGTYMADEYSIRWMQDSTDHWNKEAESLIRQFDDVSDLVEMSTPQKYGDPSLESASIHDFQEFEYNEKYNKIPYKHKKMEYAGSVEQTTVPTVFDPQWIPNLKYMGCRDVKIAVLQNRYLQSDGSAAQQHWRRMIEIEMMERKKIDIMFEDIMNSLLGSETNEENMSFEVYDMTAAQWKCFKSVYADFENMCEKFNDFALRYVKYLVHLCHVMDTDRIVSGFAQTCN